MVCVWIGTCEGVLGMTSQHSIRSLLAATMLCACGGSTQLFDGDGGGAPGAGGGGAAPTCELPASGADFVFTIRNVGTRELVLSFGCGSTMPILLDTPDGERGIGEGNADFCAVPCELVYDGFENFGCSDCGPGQGEPLMPGTEVSIDWDRRYFVEHDAPPACTGHPDANSCSLGIVARPGEVTSGRLLVCPNDTPSGYCFGEDESVPFTLDLGQNGLVIEVQ